MKRLIAALCCLLIAGGGLMAQNYTAPLPAPDTETSTLPAPGSAEPAPEPTGVGGFFSRLFNRPARPAATQQAPATASPGTQRTPPPASGQQPAAPAGGQQPAPGAAEQRAAGARQTAAAARPAATSASARKRGLYAGLTMGMSIPDLFFPGLGGYYLQNPASGNYVYKEQVEESPMPQPGAFLGVHAGGFGDIQLEALLSFDSVELTEIVSSSSSSYETTTKLTGMSLMLPLVVKHNIRLGSFVIQPQWGVFFDLALGNMHAEVDDIESGETPFGNPPGNLVGLGLGWNFRTGMLFLDARYHFHWYGTEILYNGEPDYLWYKTVLTFAIGYRFN